MVKKNTNIGQTCEGAHCTNSAASPWWARDAFPTYEGKTIFDLKDNPLNDRDGHPRDLELKRFVWFYIVVHKVCKQPVLAKALGRSPVAIRLVILLLRKEAENLTKLGIPLSDSRWDFTRPAPDPSLAAPTEAAQNADVHELAPLEEEQAMLPPASKFTPVNQIAMNEPVAAEDEPMLEEEKPAFEQRSASEEEVVSPRQMLHSAPQPSFAPTTPATMQYTDSSFWEGYRYIWSTGAGHTVSGYLDATARPTGE